MISAKIAVLDDEKRMADILSMILQREGLQVDVFYDPPSFCQRLQEESFDLLITDLKMPGMDGIAVLKALKEKTPEVPVILMTAHATIKTAIEAIKEGAFDYLEKPFDNEACVNLIKRALHFSEISRENRYLREELKSRYSMQNMIIQSKPMNDVMDLAIKAARSRATVLISGASGSGKELIARSIHYYSDRVGKPFLAVNCKALTPSLLESELFGHDKGAFTGADRSKAGLFEKANHGTLFLDEIGEVDLDFQGKILRTLQEREVVRVGSSRPVKTDVRIVCATNKDLNEEVKAGRFREDLFFRLAVIPIQIPSLRARQEDILPLAGYFVEKFCRELGKDVLMFSSEAQDTLLSHTWPGNVRELENSVERAVVLANDSEIGPDDLMLSQSTKTASDKTLAAYLDTVTKNFVAETLKNCHGIKVDACKQLGIERTTLYRLIKKYGIES